MTALDITIEYVRPGKGVSFYHEDLLYEDEYLVRTNKQLPEPIAEKLTQSLREGGYISASQRCAWVSKVYFFHENFNLVQFQDETQQTLGYYSDIGSYLQRIDHGYRMTDWFLDIWLYPDGRLVELDLDEFEEALAQGLITPQEATLARAAFARLLEEARQGMYPQKYLAPTQVSG